MDIWVNQRKGAQIQHGIFWNEKRLRDTCALNRLMQITYGEEKRTGYGAENDESIPNAAARVLGTGKGRNNH